MERLLTKNKIKLEKWTYCLFLNDKKTFYLPKWLYEQEMEKFCRYRQENHIKFKTFIKTSNNMSIFLLSCSIP